MPLLFFAVASTSTKHPSQDPCSSLALHPGSGGWTSARACSYPQEILLQLPRGAEIHEVEVAAPFSLAPRAVDVFLSAGSREDRLAGNPNFQHVCCLELRGVGSKPSRLLKAKHKFFGLCTGQVRLLIHEPVASGSENPYKQVSLATVDLWGYEDVLPETSGPLPLDLGEHHEDIASVLMELGVPLNLVPVSDGFQPAVADAATCSLIRELRDKEDQLIRESKFGEAQKVAQHVQQLDALGQELQSLLEKREMLSATRDLRGLEQLAPEIATLETRRLHMAALYETDWWISAMSAGFGQAKDSLAIPTHSALTPSASATSTQLVAGSADRGNESPIEHPQSEASQVVADLAPSEEPPTTDG
ncbi:CEP104 [Symbiodinium sp. CCMP2456]|nr:CEP104 [Symbiodinium sp. CCMP2456]